MAAPLAKAAEAAEARLSAIASEAYNLEQPRIDRAGQHVAAALGNIFNIEVDPEALTRYKADKGYFETVFEASGSAVALTGAMEITRPGGTIVQLGLSGGEMSLPINMLVAKEITLRGTFRDLLTDTTMELDGVLEVGGVAGVVLKAV